MYIIIISTKVRFPKAPNVDMMMLRRTLIVLQDWASFRTRNWKRNEIDHLEMGFRLESGATGKNDINVY